MRRAVTYKLACASLLACLSVGAGAESAKAETKPMDAIIQALAKEVKVSICTGGSNAAPLLQTPTKSVGFTQKPTSIGSRPTTTVPNTPPQNPLQMDHSHIPVSVPETAPTPQLSTVLTRDVMSGYNLHIRTANYDMSPPPVGVMMEQLMDPRTNTSSGFVQGHAHLYINGEKIQRVYGNHVHIPASHFKAGMNQLNITINNHAHMFWTAGEKQIISSLFINTSSPNLLMHQFDSFPVEAK